MPGKQVEALGVRLHVAHDGGARGRPPIILLHGFTGSAASWEPVVARLAGATRVITPDLLGHGRSDAPPNPEPYGMGACVRQLLALADALEAPQADWLGYSMGGRIAMHVALQAPRRVRRLVLESASPGIPDPRLRSERAAQDLMLADRIEQDGVEAFVDWWMAQPLFATQRRLGDAWWSRSREERLAHPAHGLAQTLRGLSVGLQDNLAPKLAKLDLPTLLVSGAEDAKYTAQLAQLARRMPRARQVAVAGAGHTVHAEQPEAFADEVARFLAEPDEPPVAN